ncbi:chemokine-like factor [Larimichthys crocea]|uniref:chemokine-like factor n=1 Tax=Larimichthys crocea TaxID=215358 RepID=UPI000622F47F|nr:chemokine-like factor [Larimichthys crocea]
MSEYENTNPTIDVDTAFLKSKRGIVKVAEMVAFFLAFVCFTVASTPKYIAATVIEFLLTLFLVLLYVLKLHKRLTFFFWPFVDLLNSAFAAVYFIVLSLIAVITYTVTGTLVGGIFGLLSAGLLCADAYMLWRNITLNKPRSETQNQTNNDQIN